MYIYLYVYILLIIYLYLYGRQWYVKYSLNANRNFDSFEGKTSSFNRKGRKCRTHSVLPSLHNEIKISLLTYPIFMKFVVKFFLVSFVFSSIFGIFLSRELFVFFYARQGADKGVIKTTVKATQKYFFVLLVTSRPREQFLSIPFDFLSADKGHPGESSRSTESGQSCFRRPFN